MDALQTVVRAGEYILPSVALAAIVLLLIGRLLPIGLASRIWIRVYLVPLGLGWLLLGVCWISLIGIGQDNHAGGEVFLVASMLSWIIVPLTIAAVSCSLWRYRIS